MNLPTGVGMNRILTTTNRRPPKSPHRRGDEPGVYMNFGTPNPISPQAWG